MLNGAPPQTASTSAWRRTGRRPTPSALPFRVLICLHLETRQSWVLHRWDILFQPVHTAKS